MNTVTPAMPPGDQKLVALHLAGDPHAFRSIVERHQGMVCALAYSACGDVTRSEDIAQEVFVAAWKQLPQLREPAKLRGWLGGITRNLAHNALRRAARTPTARAEELSPEAPADAAGPRELAIGADETGLMWNALGGLPETYRETMVLFYREGHSVAAVAAALEISEDTAKQRLARGRALLTERMAALVAETLERSGPAPTFVASVLVLLPGPLAPGLIGAGGPAAKTLAAAGAMGGAAAKGGLAVKVVSVIAFLPALLNGAEDFIKFRARHRLVADPLGRRRVAWTYLIKQASIGVVVFCIIIVPRLVSGHGFSWIYAMLGLTLVAAIWTFVRAENRLRRALSANEPAVFFPTKAGSPLDYRTSETLFGLPLLHVRLGGRPGSWRWRPAVKAWIAVSDGRAVGALFAFGPLALAPVSIGIVSVGLLGIGLFSFGGGALGLIAAGWWSCGQVALGISAAQGVVAIAPLMASFNSQFASLAGAEAARAFFQNHWFYRFTAFCTAGLLWAGIFGWVLPLVLAGWQLWRSRGKPASV